ncbi:hypothetical protein N0V90_007036 [Kalmusia sp. IMI 367209]|nr:hypothetical protein N0V90_007036 [Kalmusia sp. IMI 367209]
MGQESRMRTSVISATIALLAARSIARPIAENTCTVLANGFEAIDDSPAINDALKECGNGGTIVLPAGEYYSVWTPIDFSYCRSCDFQIEGTLLFASSQLAAFAHYDKSVFTIANATGVRIRSVTGTGVIDGNAYDWYQRSNWNPHLGGYPFVHITNSSSNISVSNLHFKNIQDRFFILQGNSHNLRFDNLRLTAEGINGIWASFDNFGFEMGQVANVSITNVDMDFRAKPGPNERPVGTCIAFDHGTDSVDVRNVTCRRAWMGAAIVFSTIFPYVAPTANTSTSTVSNVVVSNFTFDGAHATGVNSWFNLSKRVIRNVLWEWVRVENGTAADFDPCYSTQRSTQYIPQCLKMVTYDAKGLRFEHFRGNVASPPTDPNWGTVGNGLMDVQTEFVDWVADV